MPGGRPQSSWYREEAWRLAGRSKRPPLRARECRLRKAAVHFEHFDRVDAGGGDDWGSAGEADDHDHQQSDAVRCRIPARDAEQLTLDEASARPRERQASGQAQTSGGIRAKQRNGKKNEDRDINTEIEPDAEPRRRCSF